MWFRDLLDALSFQPSQQPRREARPASRSRRRPASRLSVEPLEGRAMLATMISVGDAFLVEGNTGLQSAAVVVSVSAPHSNSITVNYGTVNGTAILGSDYNAVSGKLTFARGEMSKTILIPIRGDRIVEADEYFSLQLSSPKGAKIADGTGHISISDNEPRISIVGASVLEGHSGTAPLTFTVALSRAYDLPVTVNFATSDGSAIADSDYTAAAGTLTFAPGQTSREFAVDVLGDRAFESNENLVVTLTSPSAHAQISQATASGTILDDEPRISVGDANNYGETWMTFIVSLSAASDQVVTVDYATWDGDAIAGVDYVAASGTLTFDIGQTTQAITIEVLNTYSVGQYFYLQLSNASDHATISNEWASGYWYYDYGYGSYNDYYYDYGYYDYSYYYYGYYS